MRLELRTLALLVMVATAAIPQALARTAASSAQQSARTKELQFAGSRIGLSLEPGHFRLSEADIADWVLRSARATATYFGRFPVAEVHIAIEVAAGDDVTEGAANAGPNAEIRVAIGRHTTRATLRRDSTMVHEMTHLGFPDIEDAHLWLHEGIASYVEVVARAQALEITPEKAWARFGEELPQGLPHGADGGLDNTPSEDRRYWGGATFCLIADIEIRRRTGNRAGLRDALRAILDAGGTLADTWQVERALAIGDRAVGVPVLSELYATWKSRPVAPDLPALWERLGVHRGEGGVAKLIDTTPLATIRRAITAVPEQPLLLVGPSLLHEAIQRR
jgi:hypothetical protein